MEVKKWETVFLDRDGTINEEVGYIDRIEKLQIIPGAAGAIRRINESGMKAVVVTNQSGIARGYFDEAFVLETHARLREMLRKEGASIDAFFFCPHHPSEGKTEYVRICDCRKPAPGMLLRAAGELRIDLERSYIIGDTLRDMEAGARAGTRRILVRTGFGEESLSDLGAIPEMGGGPVARPTHICADLPDAVNWILRDRVRISQL
jgi:D-glycero-D-manno-heptose 1,7-bisphosphate phosphatase